MYIRKHLKLIYAFLILLAVSDAYSSVTGEADSLLEKMPIIKMDSAAIHNDSSLFENFFSKLKALEASGKGTVTIVHIGDSHIQADFFSGELRQRLQLKFGNAGRGLVFPYHVAKTNEPTSIRTISNSTWKIKRNAFPKQDLPIGISGITIESNDTNAAINLKVLNQGNLDYSFSKMTLFHEKTSTACDFAVFDSLANEIGYIKSDSASDNDFASIVKFKHPVKSILLKSCPRSSSQTCARIYGLLLENEQPGVLYDMIGVNGTEYQHYNQSAYFLKQLSYLKPDLIIVSLGTNEGYNGKFETDKFKEQVSTFITNLKTTNQHAGIIVTTPGDSFKRSKKGSQKNPTMKLVRDILIGYCKKNSIAYWDLYSVMGGFGSMAQWFKHGLTAKDKLHFNAKGYKIQGTIFYKNLITAYERYKLSSVK